MMQRRVAACPLAKVPSKKVTGQARQLHARSNRYTAADIEPSPLLLPAPLPATLMCTRST